MADAAPAPSGRGCCASAGGPTTAIAKLVQNESDGNGDPTVEARRPSEGGSCGKQPVAAAALMLARSGVWRDLRCLQHVWGRCGGGLMRQRPRVFAPRQALGAAVGVDRS